MRKFQVGDRVKVESYGRMINGVVVRILNEYAMISVGQKHSVTALSVNLELVEAVEDQKSCGTCAYEYICDEQGARCECDGLTSWMPGKKFSRRPEPEVERQPKTITVDEATRKIARILAELECSPVNLRTDGLAYAIAEAFKGVTIK